MPSSCHILKKNWSENMENLTHLGLRRNFSEWSSIPINHFFRRTSTKRGLSIARDMLFIGKTYSRIKNEAEA